MSMTRWMMIAALAASSVGCVANQGDAPVRFLDARTLKDEGGSCALGETQRPAGQLDVSGGQGYLVALRVETNTVAREIRVGTTTVAGGGLSDFTFRELILTYETSAGLVLPEEERIPLYAVFRPGTSADGSYAVLPAFGPEALTALSGVTAPVTVLSTIKVAGVFSGGQKMETNEITFPVTVINSGYVPGNNTCSRGGLPLEKSWTCGQIGQDNGPICPTTP
ncbi:MAG TPA: hypothetical protein VF794_04820 [Archangium sp.]|uniref:hypothetical protein n=1 Tax=Archangium sp. TaxID=1872627 RepID=UPI002ED8BFAD